MLNRILTVSIVSLLLCLLVALLARNKDFAKHNDPHEYAHLGENIWSGEGLLYNEKPDVVLPPGFPIVIGTVNKMIDNLEWSGKIIGLVSFFMCLLFIFKISRVLVSEKYALLPVLLFATNSNVLLNATNGYGDSLFTFVFLVLAWLTIAFKDSTRAWPSLLFMILWPVLYYIRPEGLIIGLILFCWFVFDSKARKQFRWLIPVVFLALSFPYVFFLKTYTGNWQLSGKTYANLILGELDSPYRYKHDRTDTMLPRYRVIEHIWNDPTEAKTFSDYVKDPGNDIIKRLVPNLGSLFLVYWHSFSIIGIILFCLGLVSMDSKKRTFLLSLFLPVVAYLLFFILHRMVAIYHWMFVVFMTYGIIEYEKILEVRFPNYRSLLFGTVIVLLCLYQLRSAIKIVVSF